MKLYHQIKSQLRLQQRGGVLTDRLVQSPADFGLGQLPNPLQPDAVVDSVCGFCATGCSLKVHLKQGAAINLSANPEYPVNIGMACPKGWESLAPLAAKDRAEQPLLRDASGQQQPVEWTQAMDAFCSRFKAIQAEHGPESVAFLSTGQIVAEEMAFLGALAKFGMGWLHGDGNTRQCMATAVVAYKQAFGFDAPPYTYQDFEESDVLVFVGANPCIAHPIMWQRVMRNQRQPEIVVVDPRKTESAMAATQHLQIQPKSDLVLFYGLAARIIELGRTDADFIAAHTQDFAAFERFLADYSLEKAAQASGITIEQLDALAHLISSGKRVSFWWTMGVNQSYEGTRLAQSLINLALMTGNIGKPGTGANSITGQCNAMGSRLFSNTTGLLGGRQFEDARHREQVAERLGIPAARIPSENSLSYCEIIDGIEAGRIKGLWMIATNSAHSWINQKRFARIREQLDFFVVQDLYATTESAQLADLVLPAAGWGEKEGVFINSERRIGRTRKVRQAPGQALSDFNIFRLIAHHWGCGEWFQEWSSPEAVFKILRDLSQGMPCDFTGITDYAALDQAGGIQWPYPAQQVPAILAGADPKQRRLFEDGCFYHPDQRAKFMFEAPRAMPEPSDQDYPFLLLTGRGTSSQWHTQTRTGKSSVLRKLYPQHAYVEMHPDDAARLQIADNAPVSIRSRRGQVVATAVLLTTVQPGQVFMPMHYRVTNQLTADAYDPYSKQPSYKACAVHIAPYIA